MLMSMGNEATNGACHLPRIIVSHVVPPVMKGGSCEIDLRVWSNVAPRFQGREL